MAYTTIDDPSAYFKVQLYTGNGSANHAITFDDTDTDMQPDFVWIKNRDATDEHCLFDSVRGATKVLHITTAVEATDADTLDSFTSDGFQVDADVKVNTNTEKYVAWCWKAGTTSGIDATGADITPSAYSFNQTSGFSIIKYTGNDTADTQVAHGIGAVPKFGIFKSYADTTHRWQTYHHSLATNQKLYFDDTHAAVTDVDAWNETDPTSVNWTIDTEDDANESGELILAYSWAEVQGFSKFGKYTGYDNDDGPFIYTGFRPSIVLIKRTGSAGAWWLANTAVNPGNLATITGVLRPNSNAVETTDSSESIDILANGFKLRQNGGDINYSGEYIYAAFAEAPFVNSNGVPCNAR